MHYHYAEPSPATLAYSGKGIGYYTHCAREAGNYRLAPVDQFGYRTKTWEMMRNLNLQIHALAWNCSARLSEGKWHVSPSEPCVITVYSNADIQTDKPVFVKRI
ncbi:MAG: hypothetical protein LBJ01_06525 [Tannerella sp.]|jgi:hypothetical protein|nr:hypothetical protein [Tannerella sp.]